MSKIDFIGDNEKMYFQVQAAEKHRTFLRFLWWKDGDLSKDPIDHQICVHVFDGVSSEACSNCTIKSNY